MRIRISDSDSAIAGLKRLLGVCGSFVRYHISWKWCRTVSIQFLLEALVSETHPTARVLKGAMKVNKLLRSVSCYATIL